MKRGGGGGERERERERFTLQLSRWRDSEMKGRRGGGDSLYSLA